MRIKSHELMILNYHLFEQETKTNLNFQCFHRIIFLDHTFWTVIQNNELMTSNPHDFL